MGASSHLKQYAALSPVAKREYRACLAEEGDVLREHGFAIAPRMPFELVGDWIDAGMPQVVSDEEAVEALFGALEAALAEGYGEAERATGGALTVDAILSGEAPQGLTMGRWVEGVVRQLRDRDPRLDELPVRVRARILLGLAYDTLVADGPFADASALRAAMVARAGKPADA
jgi:hypothetical protein